MAEASRRASTERKIETVGKDRVRVEFTIDELVNLAILDPVGLESCNGCNHCSKAVGTDLDFERGVEHG